MGNNVLDALELDPYMYLTCRVNENDGPLKIIIQTFLEAVKMIIS